MAVALQAMPITEKRTSAAACVTKDNAVYTRTVVFYPNPTDTAGAANLTGMIIPAGTLVLGGSVKFSVAQGGTTTWKFGVATDGDFSTAAGSDSKYNTTNRVSLMTVIPIVTTADRQVVATTAAAAVVAGAGQSCELTLVLCAVGEVVPRAAASGN